MSFRPLRQVMLVALLSALAFLLSIGVSTAQAAMARGPGAPRGAALVDHGPRSAGVVALALVIVAIGAGLVAYALVVGGRVGREERGRATAVEPALVPDEQDSSETEETRRAA